MTSEIMSCNIYVLLFVKVKIRLNFELIHTIKNIIAANIYDYR